LISTGEQHSVREFVIWAAEELGIRLGFEGAGDEERGIVVAIEGERAPEVRVGDCIVAVDPRYRRPAEVDSLLGDASKAREKLGWVPETSARALCSEMVAEDLRIARRHALLRDHDAAPALSAGSHD